MPIDYKKYPPNWKTEIVPTILLRANNCCEKCGLKNGQTVYSLAFDIRDGSRYKRRVIWFRVFEDANREAGENGIVKPVKVVLTVAHLDHDETNWQVLLERLRAWCQICHLRYDAVEKYNRIMNKSS